MDLDDDSMGLSHQEEYHSFIPLFFSVDMQKLSSLVQGSIFFHCSALCVADVNL